MESALYLVPLLPPERARRPRKGRRVRWPGDDRIWEWDGERWIGRRTRFDGGDQWEDEPPAPPPVR